MDCISDVLLKGPQSNWTRQARVVWKAWQLHQMVGPCLVHGINLIGDHGELQRRLRMLITLPGMSPGDHNAQNPLDEEKQKSQH